MTGTDSVVKSRAVKDTVLDMVRSLGLIVVIVALSLIFVPGLLHPSKSQRIQPVDYSNVLIGFHQVTGKTALAPIGLPAAWKPTSESLTHQGAIAHLHIGFAAPGSSYAGLEEANSDPTTFLTSVLGVRGLTQTGTTTINGARWSERISRRGERSLVRISGGVTVVITGSASAVTQRQLVGALRPALHE